MSTHNNNEEESPPVFEGFVQPKKNYFPMPNAWIDICAGIDNLAELKVVQYVLRHTWGYQEYGIAKAITVDEFMHGRKHQDGKTRMDNGTGLKSDRSVKDGLKAAIKHGYLVCEIDDTDKARIKKSYALKMLPEVEGCNLPPETGGVETTPQEESNRQVETTPLPGRNYPSDPQNLPPNQVDNTPRSEKDTLEKHSEKDTLEKQGDVTDASKFSTERNTFPQSGAQVPPSPVVDITKLTPQVHMGYVFQWLDAVRQEAKGDLRACYVRSKNAEGLIVDLITSCWNTPKELTEENVRKAWLHMWNSPPGRDGFSWKKAGITINAFRNNYGEYLERAWDDERKQASKTDSEPTQAAAPMNYTMQRIAAERARMAQQRAGV